MAAMSCGTTNHALLLNAWPVNSPSGIQRNSCPRRRRLGVFGRRFWCCVHRRCLSLCVFYFCCLPAAARQAVVLRGARCFCRPTSTMDARAAMLAASKMMIAIHFLLCMLQKMLVTKNHPFLLLLACLFVLLLLFD